MPLGTEAGLGPGDIVLDGDQAPPSEKGRRAQLPQFSARVYCGQTAGCIRIPLGTEVCLGPGDIVLDGGSAPPPQRFGGHAPNFRPISIVAKRSLISVLLSSCYFISNVVPC